MNIKLFKQDALKKLVFVLRDYSDDENFEKIKESILKDIDKIWIDIKKPLSFHNVRPEALFKIEFFKLSHKLYNKSEFQQGLLDIRETFYNFSHPAYIFRDFDYSHNLPLVDLMKLMHSVWDQILVSKDLNLPSQKVMIAT